MEFVFPEPLFFFDLEGSPARRQQQQQHAPMSPPPPLPCAPPPADAPVHMLAHYAERRGFHVKRKRSGNRTRGAVWTYRDEEDEDEEEEDDAWGGHERTAHATHTHVAGKRRRRVLEGVTCRGVASRMQKQDWAELRNFLAAFPDMTPHDVAEEVAFAWRRGDGDPWDALGHRTALIDLKDAWRLARVDLVDAVRILAGASPDAARVRAYACGVLAPAHGAFVFLEDLTPISSLALSLGALREQAHSSSLRREELVALANARAAEWHAATASTTTLQVTPAHVQALCNLYPGARRSVAGVNEWIACTGMSFVCVPRYTRLPRMALLENLGHGTVVQPLALEQLAVKYGLRAPRTVAQTAGTMRAIRARATNATFSYGWPTDAYSSDNDTDSFLNAFEDMAPEEMVCWGTLGHQQRLSVAELVAWFSQPGRISLDRFGSEGGAGAMYNIAQAHSLCDVLRGYEARMQQEQGQEQEQEQGQDSACQARALRARVEELVTMTLRALELDAVLVDSFLELGDEEKKAVMELFRTLQELAAYCLHWRGAPFSLPRLGDSVEHLVDAVDVESTLYERGVPPVIAALDAVPLELRERALALRVFVSPTEPRPGSLTLGALLESLQAPTQGEAGVGARQCVRLAARPLWQTMCTYSATFFNEALPSYEVVV